jgi:hypothetical protein
MTAVGQLLRDLPDEANRLGDFVESHGDPRRNVSFGMHDLFRCQFSVGIAR